VPAGGWVGAGYYTSRPGLKGYVREMSNMLQTCKQVDAFAALHGIKRRTTSSTDALSKDDKD